MLLPIWGEKTAMKIVISIARKKGQGKQTHTGGG